MVRAHRGKPKATSKKRGALARIPPYTVPRADRDLWDCGVVDSSQPARLPAERRNRLACELARLLEKTGQPYVEVDLAGTPLVGFRCPFCGFLAWCNPSVPSVSFHDGQGCARYHALGPSSFNASAERLGLIPRPLAL